MPCRDLPNPGIKPTSPASAGFFTAKPVGKLYNVTPHGYLKACGRAHHGYKEHKTDIVERHDPNDTSVRIRLTHTHTHGKGINTCATGRALWVAKSLFSSLFSSFGSISCTLNLSFFPQPNSKTCFFPKLSMEPRKEPQKVPWPAADRLNFIGRWPQMAPGEGVTPDPPARGLRVKLEHGYDLVSQSRGRIASSVTGGGL